MERLHWFSHQEMHYPDWDTPEKTARRDSGFYIRYFGNDLSKERQEPLLRGGNPVNALIGSFDCLHDNRVLRYCADFEAHTLHMDTQTEAGELVSVRFTGLLAHWFENVVQDNILFDMEEITIDGFSSNTKACWTRPSPTSFPPVVAPRSCRGGWAGRRYGYLSSAPPLACVGLCWPRRWNCNVYNRL